MLSWKEMLRPEVSREMDMFLQSKKPTTKGVKVAGSAAFLVLELFVRMSPVPFSPVMDVSDAHVKALEMGFSYSGLAEAMQKLKNEHNIDVLSALNEFRKGTSVLLPDFVTKPACVKEGVSEQLLRTSQALKEGRNAHESPCKC